MNSFRPDRKGAFASRPKLARQVALKRGFARAVLFAESLVPPLLPVLSIAALFLAVAWFGIFRQLPDWLRWVAVFALTFAFIASLVPFARLRWPDAAAADRLLEARNHLPHQPVAVQEDQPAFDSPFARALWHEHQIRMAEKIASLDAGFPRPDVASHDRFALRAIPALLLVAAFGFSYSNGAGTIADAFRQQPKISTDPDLRIDAWVTPPYYTGRPPLYLTSNVEPDAAALPIPQFSELTVRVTGGNGDEAVVYTPEGGTEVVTLKAGEPAAKPPGAAPATATAPQNGAAPPLAQRAYTLKLDKSGHLAVNGKDWDFAVIADKVPEIAFDAPPRRAVNGALEISFKAKDDYGLTEAHALIEPVDKTDTGATPLYPAPEYRLDLPRRKGNELVGLTSRNLTEHPLAGKRVRITLVATDGAGQTGMSKPHVMVLPGRNFSEPLAAAVAEERQTFALDTRAMPQAIALNEALALRPDETIPKLSNFLLIRSALARMKLARDETMLKDTADYLWEIALGIEDGDLSQAERRLRDAQKELSEALKRNAPDEEIQKLMAELRAAMNEFMKAMAERMQQNPNSAQQQQSQNVLRQRDLENMMNQIENLARSGNKEAAQQMLSELQRLMNNLQTGKPSQQAQNQQNSPMRQQIDKLGELLQQQQKLMDQTFGLDQALQDRMQRGDPNDQSELFEQPPEGQPPSQQDQQQGQQQKPKKGSPTDQMTEQQLRDALKQLKAQQDALAQKLKELQKGLAELGMKPGENFAEAEREMKGAGKSLGEGEGGPAVDGQGKAMQALRKGAQEMMNQIMQAMKGQQPGQGQGPGMAQGQGGQNGRDPLGRPRSTQGPDFGDDSVKVPDEIDVQRAREILDAIRDKLGDTSNGEVERHYLERLLDIR